MRSLKKGARPRSLALWIQANPGITEWDALDSAVKQEIREQLCLDQGYLCAYCESRIRPERKALDREHMRIDHWMPRRGPHGDPSRTFDWTNLIGSCPEDQGNERHCDVARGDRPLHVSPYRGRGLGAKIKFKKTDASSIAIESTDPSITLDFAILRLNAASLRSNRRAVYESLVDYLGKQKMTSADLSALGKRLETPVGNELSPYLSCALFYVRRWIKKRG